MTDKTGLALVAAITELTKAIDRLIAQQPRAWPGGQCGGMGRYGGSAGVGGVGGAGGGGGSGAGGHAA